MRRKYKTTIVILVIVVVLGSLLMLWIHQSNDRLSDKCKSYRQNSTLIYIHVIN